MRNQTRKTEVLLRTFDLPDIHFLDISEPEADEKIFRAVRTRSDGEMETRALFQWMEETRNPSPSESARDCWIIMNGRILVIWGVMISGYREFSDGDSEMEEFEFRFSEMKAYNPSPN